MRASNAERRNRFHASQVNHWGFTAGVVVGENPAWRTASLRVEPGTYRVRRLQPSARFQIVETAVPLSTGTAGTALQRQTSAMEAVVTVTLPWLHIFYGNQAEAAGVWIERIA